jgi:dTDP-4-amino-4,6-dideoxygalactose transaminase
VAETRGIPILFDSVESVYETVRGRKVGSFGRAECFSLHASKLINGFEGGYVTTDDAALADRLHKMKGFGFFGQDNVEEFGFNAKLNEVHAAMTLAGLDDLEDQVGRNRARYRAYQRLLMNLPGIRLLAFDENEKTSYKNIVVEVNEAWPLSRDATVAILNREGALARAYYAPPLHRKRMLYPTVPVTLPLTDRLAQRFMLMPCGHFVTEESIADTVGLLGFIRAHADRIGARLPS